MLLTNILQRMPACIKLTISNAHWCEPDDLPAPEHDNQLRYERRWFREVILNDLTRQETNPLEDLGAVVTSIETLSCTNITDWRNAHHWTCEYLETTEQHLRGGLAMVPFTVRRMKSDMWFDSMQYNERGATATEVIMPRGVRELYLGLVRPESTALAQMYIDGVCDSVERVSLVCGRREHITGEQDVRSSCSYQPNICRSFQARVTRFSTLAWVNVLD